MRYVLDDDRVYIQAENDLEKDTVRDVQDALDEADGVERTWWTYDVPREFPDPLGSDEPRALVATFT